MSAATDTVIAGGPPQLELRRVTKTFAGVTALEDVSFSVTAGEVHALVGENGAGKSTLVKILAGVHRPDRGEVVVDGEVHDAISPLEARARGIAIVHQEFNLVPWMTVLDNLFLGRESRGRLRRLDRRAMRRDAEAVADRLGCVLPLDETVERLSVAQRQLVEIAKALAVDARVIVMDEPSAVLAGRELEQLFDTVRAMRDAGVSIVYISHRLTEVFALADRVTVLKDGRHVGTRPIGALDEDTLVRMMVGRDLGVLARSTSATGGATLLETQDLVVREDAPPIHLTLRAGEIVGVAGLVGAGRSSLARTLAGAQRPVGGQVLRRGEPLRLRGPQDAIAAGITLIPEDRRGEGLLMPMSIQRNVGLTSLGRISRHGFLRPEIERSVAAEAIRDFDIRPGDPRATVSHLSGGNQQKVVLAKWLATEPRPEVIVLDEPTRGVDVGAKFEIYELMRRLVTAGAAILMISSELPEVLTMSDRIVVMSGGTVVGELSSEDASEEAIMRLAISRQEDLTMAGAEA